MAVQAELKEKSRSDLSKLQKLPILNTCTQSEKLSEKEEKHLREVAEYEFYNSEEPRSGFMQKFVYGSTKHKETFVLFHGQKYHLPRFIARHIESCSSPIWGWKPDGTGRMQKTKSGVQSRFQMREVY
jgi:hypothetical protein